MSSNGYRNNRSDPTERLGIENSGFNDSLKQIAFSKPSAYYKMKKLYFQYLIKDLVKELHGKIYNALTVGAKTDPKTGFPLNERQDKYGNYFGDYIIDLSKDWDPKIAEAFDGGKFNPQIPGDLADKWALDACLTLKQGVQTHVIDKIFAESQHLTALKQSAKKAELELE